MEKKCDDSKKSSSSEIKEDVTKTKQKKHDGDDTSKMTLATEKAKKGRRAMCERCDRPLSACICSALPTTISLESLIQKCRIIVLQHPHELRRKNRSLPIIELCLQSHKKEEHSEPSDSSKTFENAKEENLEGENTKQKRNINKSKIKKLSVIQTGKDCLYTVVARRLGDLIPEKITRLINDTNHALLVYPSENSVSLQEALKILNERQELSQKSEKENDIKLNEQQGTSDELNSKILDQDIDNDKITLIFLDATWKYAREMDAKTAALSLWPKDLIRVQLSPTNNSDASDSNNDKEEKESKKKTTTESIPSGFIPHRFDIRTPPSENHLSTAECIAWVVSSIEGNPLIYDTFMKPLDYMVHLWHSYEEKDNVGSYYGPNYQEELKDKDEKQEDNSNNKDSTKRKRNEGRNVCRKRPKLFSD